MASRTTLRDPVQRARLAVAGVFALHGCVSGSFAARIPWLQEHLSLSPGALGLALLTPALGAVGAMPFAGRVVHQLGSRRATQWLIVAFCAALCLPALAPDLAALCLCLLTVGVAAGLADVAMNAEGVAVEQRLGGSIMSRLHGMWSVGALAGGGLGALAARSGLDARPQLAVTALVLVALGALAGRQLLDVPSDASQEAPARFTLPRGPVLLIGLVGFCSIFAESACGDWCGVYLHHVAGADQAIAAGAYTAFALTMACARLAGDAVVERLGAVTTVRLGGLVGAAGGVLVVASRVPLPAIVGFGLMGLGVAIVVPLAFAAAGRASAHPGEAIAGVATVAYGAGLAAPAVVGGIAQATSLPVSFALVTVLTGLVAVGAGALQPRVGEAAPAVADIRAGW